MWGLLKFGGRSALTTGGGQTTLTRPHIKTRPAPHAKVGSSTGFGGRETGGGRCDAQLAPGPGAVQPRPQLQSVGGASSPAPVMHSLDPCVTPPTPGGGSGGLGRRTPPPPGCDRQGCMGIPTTLRRVVGRGSSPTIPPLLKNDKSFLLALAPGEAKKYGFPPRF